MLNIVNCKAAFTEALTKYETNSNFVDGLILGALVASNKEKYEALFDLFQQWKDDIDDLEIDNNSKRLKMYTNYLKTYAKTWEITKQVKVEQSPAKRRDEKAQNKENDRPDEATNDNLDELMKEEVDGNNSKPSTAAKATHSPKKPKSGSSSRNESPTKQEENVSKVKQSPPKSDTDENKHDGICVICKNGRKKPMALEGCGHLVHEGCIQNRIQTAILTCKHNIECPVKSCEEPINRALIVSLANEPARVAYDTMKFMNTFHNEAKPKALLWCYRCRKLSIRGDGWPKTCGICHKGQDFVRSVFELNRFVINNIKVPEKHKQRSIMAKKCLEDCTKDLKRCEDCLQWKHPFDTPEYKCKCE